MPPRRVPLRRTGRPSSLGLRTPTREAYGRRMVRERAQGKCETCSGPGTEWHHRKNRSQGGTWAPSNGLLLCSPCHRWITEHPAPARDAGWTVPSFASPSLVPVLARGRWVRLLDDGSEIPALSPHLDLSGGVA